jgi:hypothetical protein
LAFFLQKSTVNRCIFATSENEPKLTLFMPENAPESTLYVACVSTIAD